MKTVIQSGFAPLKRVLPRFVWTRLRALATALITPIAFSIWSGHLKSSLKAKALSRKGKPLPWYTYPCIHLLTFRDFSGRSVLEFGGGQSTLWWASRASRVVTIEEDAAWHAQIAKTLPPNVELHLVPSRSEGTFLKDTFLATVRHILVLNENARFDVIIIDGNFFREELVNIALEHMTEDGALICDDSEGSRGDAGSGVAARRPVRAPARCRATALHVHRFQKKLLPIRSEVPDPGRSSRAILTETPKA